MKFQPKRFVVEVKRGTSRAAFASPDSAADRFSGAEAALFGSAGDIRARAEPSKSPGTAMAEAPSGRILRSLVEPPPVVEEDISPPVRRGRKPGSKNKPKPPLDAAFLAASAALMPATADAERPRRGRKPGSKNKPKPPLDAAALAASAALMPATADAERPRRGRKPGSKNKPKPQIPTAFPPPSATGQQDLAALMRSYGFVDDGTTVVPTQAPSMAGRAPMTAASGRLVAPTPSSAWSAPPEAEAAPSGGARSRVRLRDRSSILKRYVLDIEPRPGQPGAIRARRMARAAN